MKKLTALFLAAVLLLALFACGKESLPISNPPLILAEKFLTDLDYEQAILQFDQAIDIDPKNPRGYLGKADALLHLDRQPEAVQTLDTGAKNTRGEIRDALNETKAELEKSIADGFIGLSSAYKKLGFWEIAVALLKRACEAMPEESKLREVMDGLREDLGLPAEPESQLMSLAKKLVETYESSGYRAVFEIMRSDEFSSAVSAAAQGSGNAPVICAVNPQTSCGFYAIADNTYIYFGGYDNTQRSGSGTWLRANDADNGGYVFTGAWGNDAPNGEGTSTRIIDLNAIERSEGVTYTQKSVLTGPYANGAANGPVHYQMIMEDGDTHTFNFTAEAGKGIKTGSDEAAGDYISICTDCPLYLTGSLYGVEGFLAE